MAHVASGIKPRPLSLDRSAHLAVLLLNRNLIGRFAFDIGGNICRVDVARETDKPEWKMIGNSYASTKMWIDRFDAGKEVLS